MQLFASLIPPPSQRAQVLLAITGVGPTTTEAIDSFMEVRLVRFGNVTHTDVEVLGHALQEVSPSRPLSLQIIGPASPDGARPRFELSGDLDVLDELFESVHKAARRTGLLVDRRNFSPHLAIAPPQYANVIPDLAGNAACRSFTSHEWSVDTIDLMRDTYDATGQPANVATIQLAISV